MKTLAARHDTFAKNFAHEVRELDDPTLPTPVPEWTANDVVEHLLAWPVPVLSDWMGFDLADDVTDSLTSRWTTRSSELSEYLADPAVNSTVVRKGPMAGQTCAEVIDRIYTADVFMHTWDLARANSRTPDLDPDFANELLAGMKQMEQVLRDSGQYGPPIHTSSEDPVIQLIAFIGRDPAWEPEAQNNRA